jgi:hypothetical protein
VVGRRTGLSSRGERGLPPQVGTPLQSKRRGRQFAAKAHEPIVVTGGSRRRIAETIFLVLSMKGSPRSLNNHEVLTDEPDEARAPRPLELFREGGRTVLDGFAITDALWERA